MKSLNDYINEEKKTTGAGCVEMIKTILDQLTKEHSDCQYDKEKQEWTGKDADLWKGAGQFLFEFIILPNKKVHVRVFDSKTNYEERNQIQNLEPIGDAYWAEYRYHSTSHYRDLLPVCKIAEYEKWFSEN